MVIQRSFRTLIGVMLVVLFLLHVAGILPIKLLHTLENASYDARLHLTMPNSIDPRIVILDIDEASLSEIGQWPWNRALLAQLVERLNSDYDIKLLAFDIVFAESNTNEGLEVLQQLARGELQNNEEFLTAITRLQPELMHDKIFADSLRGRNSVLGYYFKQSETLDNRLVIGKLPAPFYQLQLPVNSHTSLIEASGYGANIDIIQNSAASAGFIDNPLIDEDGVLRRAPMLQLHRNGLYESFSLAIARSALGSPEIELVIADNDNNYFEIEAIILADKLIPLGEYASALIPYRGNQYSFPYVSARDVLNRSVNPDILKNAIVIVGTTAPGLMDLRATPVQKAYAGVEIHANLVAGILDNRIMQSPAYVRGYEFILLLIIGALMLALLRTSTPWWSILFTISLLLLVAGSCIYMWLQQKLVLPVAAPITLILILFFIHSAFGFILESRNKRKLAKLFGLYIPPELVDEMSNQPGSYTLQAKSREITVLFMDVRGFTRIAERLDPELLSQLMNEFLTPMTQIIHKHRGTIDKYMGDSIMAFWGAPLDDSDHAEHAVHTALEMLDVLKDIQRRFVQKGWPPLEIGIGINTGTMSVGNMGSKFRTAYTVMGDAVNLGKRLEELTKTYAVPIILSQTTREAASNYTYMELDRVKVKGRDELITIFTPLDLLNSLSASRFAELERHKQALNLFRMGDWNAARITFSALHAEHPETLLYSLYLDRIDAQIKKRQRPTALQQ